MALWGELLEMRAICRNSGCRTFSNRTDGVTAKQPHSTTANESGDGTGTMIDQRQRMTFDVKCTQGCERKAI